MVDENFKMYLIEVNNSPSLDMPCKLLKRLIPTMIDDMLKLTLDDLFPPS